ncbi:AAA family ATPase [Rhodocyclaceae bacterium SMB388]
MNHTENALIRDLLDPVTYPHRVESIECIETHVSWILLAGDFAYKLKKPLDLGFLDYSTLERRRVACEDEVRLNRRTAPDVYVDVVPIAAPGVTPRVGGAGPVLEYAVRMRRFDQTALLSSRLEHGLLTAEDVDGIASHVAAFHASAAVARPGAGFGDAGAVRFPVRQNFEQLRERIDEPDLLERLSRIEAWSEAEFVRLADVFERRLADGRVRECHGDLHLGNIVMLESGPCLFDGIEFNPQLRWIDVIADAGFLVMDLQARGENGLANRFLNAYLEHTGDYAGLQVLSFYVAYRAMVRAKVAAIRLGQLDRDARTACHAEIARYLHLAESCSRREPTALFIACGLSGSGKSSQSLGLIEARGLIRLRSDVERKRLFGLTADARSSSPPDGGIYTASAGDATYARLAELAGIVIGAQRSALVDATFLAARRRAPFRKLAAERGVPFVILSFDAPIGLLRERVTARAQSGTDVSEAGPDVLEVQRAQLEPPTDDEASIVLRLASGAPVRWEDCLPELDRRMARPPPVRGG